MLQLPNPEFFFKSPCSSHLITYSSQISEGVRYESTSNPKLRGEDLDSFTCLQSGGPEICRWTLGSPMGAVRGHWGVKSGVKAETPKPCSQAG